MALTRLALTCRFVGSNHHGYASRDFGGIDLADLDARALSARDKGDLEEGDVTYMYEYQHNQRGEALPCAPGKSQNPNTRCTESEEGLRYLREEGRRADAYFASHGIERGGKRRRGRRIRVSRAYCGENERAQRLASRKPDATCAPGHSPLGSPAFLGPLWTAFSGVPRVASGRLRKTRNVRVSRARAAPPHPQSSSYAALTHESSYHFLFVPSDPHHPLCARSSNTLEERWRKTDSPTLHLLPQEAARLSRPLLPLTIPRLPLRL